MIKERLKFRFFQKKIKKACAEILTVCMITKKPVVANLSIVFNANIFLVS